MIVSTVAISGLILHSLQPPMLFTGALVWLAFAIAMAGRAWRAARDARRWERRIDDGAAMIRSILLFPPVAIAVLLVVGSFIWRVFLVTRLPVVDYDGWSYHLVFVDVWLQHDAIVAVPQRPWTAGYPAVGELLMTWLAAFTRSDAPTGLVSVLLMPVSAVATVGLGRGFGAERRWAILAGLLFAMVPSLVALAGTTYVDTTSVASVIATWWIGLRVLQGERDRSAALLLGVAGGLALGTKGTNLLLVSPMLAVAFLLFVRDTLRRPRSEDQRSPLVAPLTAFGLPILLVGASWYLKNLLVHGNPVYPIAVGPFPGPISVASQSWAPAALEGFSRFEQIARSWVADWGIQRYAYEAQPGGFGRAWLAIIPLATIGLVLLVRRQNIVALLAIVTPVVVGLLIAPNQWQARYTLAVPALGLVFASVALTRMRPRMAMVVGLVLVGLAAVSLTFANVRPNVSLQPEAPGGSVKGYVSLLLDGDPARRSNIGLRADCAGFDVIPPGDRVAPGGFNLLHAVAGPDLQRILTDPIDPVSGSDQLVAAMREQRATWIVTRPGLPLDTLAASTPDLLGYGETCGRGRLWRLAPATGP
jgi:4-amino-4-deoxy-L-arabinose transferase-like glycosyltransferase